MPRKPEHERLSRWPFTSSLSNGSSNLERINGCAPPVKSCDPRGGDRPIVPSRNRARLGLEMAGAFDRFVEQRTVLLTTYRRDGTAVGTPVNIVVDSERAFVRTFDTAWKLKRIRNNPTVEIAPSTIRGKPTGAAVGARARVLGGSEAEHASRLLNRKYPILHGVLVPLTHRLRGNKTIHIELAPLATKSS